MTNDGVGINKYKCGQCNYNTGQEQRMKEHMLAHLGRHVCSGCNKAFTKVGCLSACLIINTCIKFLVCEFEQTFMQTHLISNLIF